MKKKAKPEKRSKHGKKGSQCAVIDYTAPTPPLLESQYLDQFPHRKMSLYNSSSTIETPNTQSSPEDNKNVFEMPHRSYGLVTYD